MEVLADQLAYYRARAPEYDEWFERRGRYDRGPDLNARWGREVAEVRAGLQALGPRGLVVDLAAGTGNWTVQLATTADRLIAVDGSPEMLAINRARAERLCLARGATWEGRVRNLLSWSAAEERLNADFVCAGFWLSHVPDAHLGPFLEGGRRLLKPGGRFFVVDSLLTPESRAQDHPEPEADAQRAVRKLNDGRTFRIVKRVWTAATLSERLRAAGFEGELAQTERFFLYGAVST